MAQVLIERPRRGARFGYRRQRRINRRTLAEDAPRREGVHRRQAERSKHFNDLFGPLKRFLNRNVGRPWDTVFSEVCEHARLDNIAGQHLRRHVHDFVETSVILVDGVPCYGAGWDYGRPLQARWRTVFYVCPATGLLRRIEKQRRRQSKPPARAGISKWRQFHRAGDTWYVVALRPIPDDAAGCFDALIGRRVVEIPASERIKTYGRDAYALSSRRATAAELCELRLMTTQPDSGASSRLKPRH